MTEAKRHPVDVDAIEKGTYISPGELEEIVGVSRDDRRYPLLVLRVKEQIDEALLARRRELTIKGEGDGLRVLTDEEAVEYNISRRRSGENAILKARRKQGAVNPGQLSSETLRMLEREMAYLNAVRNALKQASQRRALIEMAKGGESHGKADHVDSQGRGPGGRLEAGGGEGRVHGQAEPSV